MFCTSSNLTNGRAMKNTAIHKDVRSEIQMCCIITGVLVLGTLLLPFIAKGVENPSFVRLSSVIASVCGTQLGLIFASLAFLATIIEKKKRLIEEVILEICNNPQTTIKHTVFDLNDIKNNSIAPQPSVAKLRDIIDVHDSIVQYRKYIRHMGSIPLVFSAALSVLSCIALLLNDMLKTLPMIRTQLSVLLLMLFVYNVFIITHYVMKLLRASEINIEDLKK